MKQRKREQTVRWHMHRYAKYKKDLANYVEDVMSFTPNKSETGIRSGKVADIVAKAAIALIDIPKHLQEEQAWVEAIETAYKELLEMDRGNQFGYAYTCNKVYGMDGKKKRSVIAVSMDCGISERALYRRLNTITNVMCYHATKHNLI